MDTGALAGGGGEDNEDHDDLEDFELRVKDTWWFQVIQGYRASSELTDEQMELLKGHVNVHIASFPLTTSATAKFLRGLPSTIVILELRNCSLNSRSVAEGLFFSNCPSIQSLCLAENLLTTVPFFLDRLQDLRFLDLSYNRLSHGSTNTDSSNVETTDTTTVKSAITDKTPMSLGEASQMQANNSDGQDIRQSLGALRVSCNLIYLNLEGNKRLTCHSYYRDMIISTLPTLKALDGHLVCDEELYGAIHGRFQLFPPPYCAGHKNFRVPPSFKEEGPDFDLVYEKDQQGEDNARSMKRKTKMRKAGEGTIMVPVFNNVKTRRMMEIRKHLNVKESVLEQQYRMTSPVVKIQRLVRDWLKWLKFRPLRVYAHLASLQARVRRFLFVQRCKKDLKATLQAAGEWNDVLDADMVENHISMGKSRDQEEDAGGTSGMSKSMKMRLKGSYEMQAHARTVGLFMRTAVMYRRRLKAAIKVQTWMRRVWRQWSRNLEHLQGKEVRGLVVPAGSEEALLDVLAHFEDRRRAYHQGSASDNSNGSQDGDEEAAGDAYYEYSAEPLYEVERRFVRRGKKELDAVRAKMETRGLQLREMSAVKRVCFHPCSSGALDDSDDGDVAAGGTAAARMRLAAHRHGLWRLIAQAEPTTRTMTHALRRRGCCVQRHTLHSALRACREKLHANATKTAEQYPHAVAQALVVVGIPSDRMAVLSDAMLYIQNPRNHYYSSLAAGGIWYDVDVEEEMSAMRLQALWRGVRFRRSNCARVMDKLISRRAAVCVQWWWRYRNGLGRRLSLLRTVRSVCMNITEPALYLDLWSFYWILRQRHLPFLSRALELFPEMRGTPHVTAAGRAVMKGLRDDVVNCPQYSAEAAKRVAEAATTAAATSAASGLANENVDHRNFNMVNLTRFGLPQWLPHRPLSEEFYRGRHTDGYHKSRYEYEQEYSLYARRRDMEFPLYDLVSKGAQVNLRPVKIPLDKASGASAGGKEPYSRRWYQDGLHFSPTDAEADLRVVELTFPSLQEARARAALLVICTYDYLSHSSVIPMPSSVVKDRVYRQRKEIIRATQQMTADLKHAKEEGKGSGMGGSAPYAEQAENEAPTSGMQVVAPIEKDVLLQTGPLAGWVARMKYSVWDLMRFRFLCHCLLVCSNTNVSAVNEILQPKVPTRVAGQGAAEAAEVGKRRRKGAHVRTNELLTRDVEHSLVSFSDSLYSAGGDSPDASTSKQRKRIEGESDAESEAEARGTSLEGSVEGSIEGVPVPAELYSEIVDVQRHLEESTELGSIPGPGGDMRITLALGSEATHKSAVSFLASGVVTGRQWSPRDSEARGLLAESSLERRELAKVGAAGSSEVPPVPLVPGDASLDGFESEVSGKSGPEAAAKQFQPRPERLYEAKRAVSPPSNKQLRSIGVAAGSPPVEGTMVPPIATHIGRSSSGPLATNATAGAGAGANSYTVHHHPAAEMNTRWKTTAALSYLKSSVWDASKVMMWCSRGFDHGSGAAANADDGAGYCSRTSLEDFNNVATSAGAGAGAGKAHAKNSRYFIPVRPHKGHDKERGMNEQKAMVARLEALQLGMYEYAMRLAKLEKVNHTNASAATAAAAARPRSPGNVTPGGTGRGVTAALAHTAALHRNYYSGTTGVADALTGNELHHLDQLLDPAVQPSVPTFPYPYPKRAHDDLHVIDEGKNRDREKGDVPGEPGATPRGGAASSSSSSSEESGSEYFSVDPRPDVPSAARLQSERDAKGYRTRQSRSPSPSSPGRASPINDSIALSSVPGSQKRASSPPTGRRARAVPASPEAWVQQPPTSADTSAGDKALAMSTSPIRLRSAPTVRPEAAALHEASAAQEERERDIMMMQTMRDREAPQSTRDRVYAARVKKTSDAKQRRRFKRRDRAVKSHIKQLQRDDQALVRQYQRDMHVERARGWPHPHSREDWTRPANTGYTPGSAYANQVANLAADVHGGLPELSTQSSVPSDTSGAVKRPPKTTARTLHSPVGVGSAPPRRDYYAGAGAGVGVMGRQGPGPAAEGGRMHIQAHMPPAVREELRDRDAVSQSQSSMSSFWYSTNPRGVPGAGSGAGTGVGGSTAASLDLGLYFSDVRASDAPSGTAKTGRTTMEGWGGGISANGWDNYLDHSGSGSIYDLSGSEADLDSLGIRLDADPNYADLLAPTEQQRRYGSVNVPVKPSRDKSTAAGRPSSGALRKQQWQQSKKDGSSFIKSLLANAGKVPAAAISAVPSAAVSAAASATASAAASPRSVHTGVTTLSSRAMPHTKPARFYKEPAATTTKRSSLENQIDLTVISSAARIGGMAVEVASQPGEPLELRPRSKSGKGSKDSGDRRESLGSVDVGMSHQFVPQRAPKYVVAAESPFLPEINHG